jgi:hypothetical protein
MKKYSILVLNILILSVFQDANSQSILNSSSLQNLTSVNLTSTATNISSQIDYHSFPYWIEMMQDPNANFFETQRAFYEYWDGREVTKGSGYKVFKRWEYWMSRKVSPDGLKPSPWRNIEAFEKLNTEHRSILEGNWTSLGPVTVPSGYNGYRGIGRVNALAFHPTDANTIYIGAPAGGLWATYNGGNTWIALTDDMPTLGVSAIAVDYNNPDIIYLGTGDRDHSDAPGLGVWKSMDAGMTFQPSNAGISQVTISKLLIHPSNPNIILAASNGGIHRSVDGGTTWTTSITGNYKDIVFKPGNPDIVYATVDGRFFKSINNGVNFIETTAGLPGGYRGAIAVTPADPEVVYFIITNSQSFKGLYRSVNAGTSFTTRSSTTPNIMSWGCNGGDGGQAWYDLDIAADPLNSNIIYAAGVNCFKSSDGGLTWNINSHWWGDCGVPAVHADLHVLEYNAVNNRLYAGNDGGVYWTANGGTSWTEISNGLVISQAYKIGQSRTVRQAVINGYQDNGTSTFTSSGWVNVNGGDGMECAYDPTNSSYSYSTIYYGPVYRHYNNDDGIQIAGEGVNGITESGGWVTPFVIDHNDGNIMFIGYDNIWRSTNIKDPSGNVTWTKISNINVDNFDQLAQSDANTNILYVSNDNQLWRSDNVKASTVTWTNLTSSLPSPNYITAIETSPIDENIVYLVQQTRVFKSTNKGVSWTEITGTLPSVQMNTLVYYHNSNEGLYLGTDIGVFYRDATNTSWVAFNTGLPSAAIITDLEIFYDSNTPAVDMVRAGTFGRGLWSSTMMNASAPAAAGLISGPTTVCQEQTQVLYTVDNITGATSYNWSLPQGATGSSVSNSILVDFGLNAVSGDISVYGVNQYGNGIPSSLSVSVNAIPGLIGGISGDNVVCLGETGLIYSVNEVLNATSYVWTLPPGATGQSNTNNITIDFVNSASTGVLSVYAVNECGVTETSNLQIIVNNIPQNAGPISGPDEVCQGDSLIMYTVEEISGALLYNWTFPDGVISVVNFNTATVNYGINAVSGTIAVYATNDCGQGSSSVLPVTVNTKPATPIVSHDGHDLHSSAATGNQWYDQNGAIPGATGQDYLVTWDGHYYTIVTLGDCESDTSNIVEVIVTDIESISKSNFVTIYPNPFNNQLTIDIPAGISTVDYQIVNSYGNRIMQGRINNQLILDTSILGSGIYILNISGNTISQQIKLVKR